SPEKKIFFFWGALNMNQGRGETKKGVKMQGVGSPYKDPFITGGQGEKIFKGKKIFPFGGRL
ncbi:hypothetical protein, partial [Clostridioides difficile]|uniref:hypothetical protein n=1 Tax=Clostridioides difficile TaxID=1496 RepID=UPI001A99D119